MCLAVPVQVVAVIDAADCLVAVSDGGPWHEVSAALVAPPADPADLVGVWVVVHTGHIMEILDDGDALSRLAMLAAISGQDVDDTAIRPPPDQAG